MFWKFATTSNIDTLLEKEDITLQELMNDDDVLQECKGQNTKLVEFLCKMEVMDELVNLIITEPTEDAEEATKYKYPNLACELLTSDVPQMNDVLGETESLREKLFSFLERDSPLNPLLASFFSKVVGILLSRKPEPTLEFIKTRKDFLETVLKHLGTSAIMDLLLRLVTCVEAADLRAQVLSWLNENQLVERLIALISPDVDEDYHCNSAQSLCDIIRLSREHMYTMQESAQEDPLLNTLEKKETVQLLLKYMFDYGINESVIINGISVMLALLEIRRPAPFGFPEMAPELTQLDVERLACGVSKTLHGLSDRLPEFHKLLECPPKRDAMHCTFGELDPPLGNTRLHVGKLLSSILITNTHNINVQLSQLQIFNALLDLFFRFEYNNFLHTQVVQCIQTVLGNAVTVTTRAPVYSSNENPTEQNKEEEEESDEDHPRKVAPLLTHLFEDCRLIQRILEAWEDNRIHETEDGGHRKGNMGHLTLITNYIIENMEKGTNSQRIRQFIEGMPEEDQGRWQKFVAEPLTEMNEKNSRELGGHNPMHFSSDDDADSDYNNIPFSSDSAHQAFTDYQLQQIQLNFIDQFGFHDGDYAEQEPSNKFDKINMVDFEIKSSTNTANQALFEDVCNVRIPNFGDSSDEDEDKVIAPELNDDDFVITNVSPFKQGGNQSNPSTPTITASTENNGDNNDSFESEPRAIKIPHADEEMDTSSNQEWTATFEDEKLEEKTQDFGSPVDSSQNVTTFTSIWDTPIEGAPDLREMRENWAQFDNTDSSKDKKSTEDSITSTTDITSTDQQDVAPASSNFNENTDQTTEPQANIEVMDVAVESSSPPEQQIDTPPTIVLSPSNPFSQPLGESPSSSEVAMETQEEVSSSESIEKEAETAKTEPRSEDKPDSQVAMDTEESGSQGVEEKKEEEKVELPESSSDRVEQKSELQVEEKIEGNEVQHTESQPEEAPAVEAAPEEVEETREVSSDAPDSTEDQITAQVTSDVQQRDDSEVKLSETSCNVVEPTTDQQEPDKTNVGDAPSPSAKCEKSVQNNEVTSSSDNNTISVNGPL